MTEPYDWRLQGQERYLQGAELRRSEYRPPRADWDHDHCEFCGSAFSRLGDPSHLTAGYCTADEYRWICRDCFSDFQERFEWTVTEDSNKRSES